MIWRLKNWKWEKISSNFSFSFNLNMRRTSPASLLERHGGQLDDESLRTFMVEAEAIVNCRPLSVDTISSSQFSEPLTPNHILTMKSKVVLPPPGDFQRVDLDLSKRWRRVQYLVNEFWCKWKRECLQSLQSRQKCISVKRNLVFMIWICFV